MSTWRGILRELERSANRIARENERLEKEEAKRSALVQAQNSLNLYNEYIDHFTSLHKECCDVVNWQSMLDQLPPAEVELEHLYEEKALDEKRSFKPSIVNKVFHNTDKKLERLDDEILKAINKDEDEYQSNLRKYNRELEEWKTNRRIAEELINKNEKAIREAVQIKFSIKEDYYIDLAIKRCEDKDNNIVIAVEAIPLNEIIPTFELSLLKSGNLSQKEMSRSKRFSLYHNYICSLLIRSARELFAILPIETVIINVICKMLNERTGYIEDVIVLSAFIPKESLTMLNLNLIDPSLALDNYKHNIDFSKTRGFKPVSQVIDV